MAKARECDICGKLYKPYHNIKIDNNKVNGIITIDRDADDNDNQCWTRRLVYDLCPECLAKFKQFITAKKETE